MSRGTVQPFRRNSALYRVYDDLILYLKAENNYVDSTYYYQQVIQPEGLNHVIDPSLRFDPVLATEVGMPLPGFDENKSVSPLSSFHKDSYTSFVFSGEGPVVDQSSAGMDGYVSGYSIAVSGTGVFTTDRNADSAAEFDLDQDFTIEFWAQFSGVPDKNPHGGTCLFDFGNLQFWNWGGCFTIKPTDDEPLDYFNYYYTNGIPMESAETPEGKGFLTQRFNHYAVQRRSENLELWMGTQNEDGTPGPFSKVAEKPLPNYFVSGHSEEPYNNLRTFGSTRSGTNFFTGWMDEIKVWKRAIYGPEPVNVGKTPKVEGIYIHYGHPWVGGQAYWEQIATSSNRPKWNYVHSPRLKCGMDPIIFVEVESYFDPRYSLHTPLPVHIDWYKYDVEWAGGGVMNRILHTKKLVATSKDGNSVNIGGEDVKYVTRGVGLASLEIKDFDIYDSSTYEAVVTFGDPARPKNTIVAKRIFLECYSDVTSCFEKNSQILMHDNTYKSIKDLQFGDWVLGFDTEHNLIKNGVQSVERKLTKNYFEVKIDDKTTLVSPSHPYYVGEGEYKDIDQLNEGDWVYIQRDQKLLKTKIQSKKFIDKELEVYNLSVGYKSNYFANDVAVHNKLPPPMAYLTITGDCGSYYTVGTSFSDPELVVSIANYNKWTITNPVTWNWSYTGTATITSGMPGDPGAPAGVTGPWSKLKIHNLYKNTGPITVSAKDANGVKLTTSCNGIFANYPDLQPPNIIDISFPSSSKDYTVYPLGPINAYGKPWNNSYYRTINIIPDQTNLTLNLSIQATDPNPPILNTGGLRYEWYNSSTRTWTDLGSSRSMTFSHNQNTYVLVRISYNSYPGNTYVTLPNGRQVLGEYSYVHWTINYPSCSFPSVLREIVTGTNIGARYYYYDGILDFSQSNPYPWGNRINYFYELQPWYWGYFIRNRLPGNLLNADRDINISSCGSKTRVIIQSFLNRNNSNYNSVVGRTATWWSYLRSKTLGYAFNSNIGSPGSGAGISVEQGGPNSTVNPATVTAYHSPLPHQRNMANPADQIHIEKKAFLNDNGSWVKVTLHGECGDVSRKYIYNVKSEPKPSLWVKRDWNFNRWNTSTTGVFLTGDGPYIVFQKIITRYGYWRWNYTTGKSWVTTGQSEKYSPWRVNVSLDMSPRTSGCMFWRIKKDGVVIKNWSPASSTRENPCQGENIVGVDCSNNYHNSNFHTPGFGARLYNQGYYRYNMSQSGINLEFKPNRSYWTNDLHTITIELANNLKGPDISTADIRSMDIPVTFALTPIILSPTMWPWWGRWSYPHWSGRWRWWYPFSRTNYSLRGRQLFYRYRYANGWYRYRYSNIRPSARSFRRMSFRSPIRTYFNP